MEIEEKDEVVVVLLVDIVEIEIDIRIEGILVVVTVAIVQEAAEVIETTEEVADVASVIGLFVTTISRKAISKIIAIPIWRIKSIVSRRSGLIKLRLGGITTAIIVIIKGVV